MKKIPRKYSNTLNNPGVQILGGILAILSGVMLVVFFAKLDEIIERQYYTMFEVSSYIPAALLLSPRLFAFNDQEVSISVNLARDHRFISLTPSSIFFSKNAFNGKYCAVQNI